jgi:hypothetical protein
MHLKRCFWQLQRRVLAGEERGLQAFLPQCSLCGWKWRALPPPLLTCAEDGGQTWRRERAADSLAANLYEVVFTRAGLGFVLGNDGVLLRVRSGPPCVLALQSEGGVAV